MKVLIVDDIPYNQMGLNMLIKNLDSVESIEFAYNGREALEKVRAKIDQQPDELYHIIFMDVNMPEMDGIEATREIKKLMLASPADVRQTKIIINSAFTGQSDIDTALNAGADGYLFKPIKYQQLLQLLQQFQD